MLKFERTWSDVREKVVSFLNISGEKKLTQTGITAFGIYNKLMNAEVSQISFIELFAKTDND